MNFPYSCFDIKCKYSTNLKAPGGSCFKISLYLECFEVDYTQAKDFLMQNSSLKLSRGIILSVTPYLEQWTSEPQCKSFLQKDFKTLGNLKLSDCIVPQSLTGWVIIDDYSYQTLISKK